MKKILVAVFLISFVSFGQKFNTLSTADKEQFEKEVNDEIQTFDAKLEKIANATSKELQNSLIEGLLRKFTKEATIQTAGVKSGTNTYKIRNYLYEKVPGYNRKYNVIDVEFVSVEIDDLKPHPTQPNTYIARYSFIQRFCAANKGLAKRSNEGYLTYDYCDLTEKEGSFILKKTQTILGAKWKLFFDSIYVKSIDIIEVNRND